MIRKVITDMDKALVDFREAALYGASIEGMGKNPEELPGTINFIFRS